MNFVKSAGRKWQWCTYILGGCLMLLTFSCHDHQKEINYTGYVNPFLGTAPLTDSAEIGYTPPKNWRVWAGLTFPGASLPNAMVQLSPITDYTSGAGYKFEDDTLYAFTHTNKGHWNLCNIPVLPVSGDIKKPGSVFSHDSERAHPGYYSVYLKDYGVNVRLTSSLRCGFHQYQYKNGNDRKIVFDLSHSNRGFRNINKVSDWSIKKAGENILAGFQEAEEEKVYFYAVLNVPVKKLIVKNEGQSDGRAVIQLQDGRGPVELKLGLSYVSEENARENLEHEILDKTFEEVRKEATTTWEQLLSKIEISGGTAKQRMLFYSSLYRSFLWPALRSDVNGEYCDVNGHVAKKDFKYYTIPSLWDTYRNKLVLMTLLAPQVTSDVIKSLLDRGDKTGFIPTFFHGDHAAPFITGAYLRGIDNFKIKEAYRLLINNATKEGGTRPYIYEYMENGYISTPQVASPHLRTDAKAAVSKTLEYAYDDYAISLLAENLGDTKNYNLFKDRSKNYINVFDSTTHFMRGRLDNGEWVKKFDPQSPYNKYMYREANAWQVSFYVPHDMEGLIQLYGGRKRFEIKLDSLFSVPWNPDFKPANVTCFIGQYSHGNQPDHEAPYEYYFIGKPERSQKIIDTVLNTLYGLGTTKLALPGMDDAGEMSAWYVFGASGLYPFSPADPKYLVSVPIFDSVRWHLADNRELLLRKPKSGRKLEAIQVNDSLLNGYFIDHKLFKTGGTLDILTTE